MDKLKNRIVALRKQNKVTQEQLSKSVGISRTTLAHYEIGRRKPDYEILQRIADYFGVTTDHLLGRDYTEEEKEMMDKIDRGIPIDKVAAETVITFEGEELSQEEKENILDFIRMMKKMRKGKD